MKLELVYDKDTGILFISPNNGGTRVFNVGPNCELKDVVIDYLEKKLKE